MRVLLVCDRSAGHIFPALSIARKIEQTQNVKVNFFATSGYLKSYLQKEGFLAYGRAFASRNILKEMVFRPLEAVYLLFRLRPKKVIGFGGRDSFFLMLFSSLLFLDTSIYEPNKTFGKANRILSFFVRRVFCGFNEGMNAGSKTKIVGIPLRQNLKIIPKGEALKALGFTDKPVIFCFGGSQGSEFLNSIFTRFVKDSDKDFQVIHLTGKREYFQIVQFYNKIKRNAFVKDFYYAMEALYSAADLVVCRAGALTLAELTYYGVCPILIPHPQASGHQKENAYYLEGKGAAFVFLQENFSFDIFKNTVEKVLYDTRVKNNIKENLTGLKLGVPYEEFCSADCF